MSNEEKNTEFEEDGFTPLPFYHCLILLRCCVDKGFIQMDPNKDNEYSRKDNILVYRKADEINPEGWYSMNIHSVAQELLTDIEGQKFLINALKEKGIEIEFPPFPFN